MKNILGFAWAGLALAGLGACSADAGDENDDAGLLMSAGSKPGETTAKEGVIKADEAPLEVADTAEALKFFAWSFAKGDKMAEELDYVPMPDKVVNDILKMWSTDIKDAGGKPLYSPTN